MANQFHQVCLSHETSMKIPELWCSQSFWVGELGGVGESGNGRWHGSSGDPSYPLPHLFYWAVSELHPFIYFLFFYFFAFFRAAPMAYRGSQARRLIGAAAASLHHSHSHTRSEARLRPTPQLMTTPDPYPIE